MLKVKEDQKKWIVSRNGCSLGRVSNNSSVDQTDLDCVERAYNARIEQLVVLNRQCVDIHSSSEAGLSIYKDRRYGFSITFPSWMKTSTDLIPDNNWRQGYSNPAHGDDRGIPIVSIFAFRASGGDQYPSGEVTIGAYPGHTESEACGSDVADMQEARINGHLFRVFDISYYGMSFSASRTSYRTFQNGYCFAIESLGSVKIKRGEEIEGSVTQKKHLVPSETDLMNIVKSFQFLSDTSRH
jgi:hypothetical protein